MLSLRMLVLFISLVFFEQQAKCQYPIVNGTEFCMNKFTASKYYIINFLVIIESQQNAFLVGKYISDDAYKVCEKDCHNFILLYEFSAATAPDKDGIGVYYQLFGDLGEKKSDFIQANQITDKKYALFFFLLSILPSQFGITGIAFMDSSFLLTFTTGELITPNNEDLEVVYRWLKNDYTFGTETIMYDSSLKVRR